MKSVRALFFLFLLGLPAFSGAETFQFLYHDGDQYRYHGTSEQIVVLNGKRVQSNLDTYKIGYKIEALPDGKGRLTGKTLYTSQRTMTNGALGASVVNEEHDVSFVRDRYGAYTIDSRAVMPVVRGVPTFPDRDLQVLDTWASKGEELQDLSGIQAFASAIPLEPLRIPLSVSYQYLGTEVRDGKTFHVFTSEYTLFQRTRIDPRTHRTFPTLLSGYSNQKHYFDQEKGRIESYEEEYSLVLTLNDGNVYEFNGTSRANLIDAKEMDKPKIVDEVKKGLKDRGLGDVDVRSNERGVVINLDNIQFPPDSSVLVPSEQEKLRLIGEVLKKYPDRDILVEGHTALAGRVEDRQRLSEERAAAVGNALVQSGVKASDRIVYRGWGSQKPIAPNDTEDNKKKNRRVEITILEN